MCKNSGSEEIFIVITQTGTVLSKFLKLCTRAEYNHASIALSPDLKVMYSFGRLNPYNPFFGGFVEESASFGTFKRFSETEALVLSAHVTNENKEQLSEFIDTMVNNKKDYGYNYMGLYLAFINKCVKKQNRYYCSEFVREMLKRAGVRGSADLPDVIKPIDFLELPELRQVYRGKLREYTYSEPCETVKI